MGKTSRDIRKLIESDKTILEQIKKEGDAREELEKKIDDFLYKPNWNDLYAKWKLENGIDTDTDTDTDADIPDVPPTPEPEPPTPSGDIPNVNVAGLDISLGKILFNSNVAWADGHDRTITKHHEFDPYDKNTEVAAGGHGSPRKFHIDGKGHGFLGGGMSRVYNWSAHQGRILILQKFIFNKTLGNMSYEMFSRHNEPLPTSNKIGGLQCAFELGQIGSKFESWHADYHSNGSKNFARKIKVGDTVPIAIYATKNDNQYSLRAFIDYDQNNTYTEVGAFTHTETQNLEGTKKQPLYWRFRTNGNAPVDVEVWDTYFIQL